MVEQLITENNNYQHVACEIVEVLLLKLLLYIYLFAHTSYKVVNIKYNNTIKIYEYNEQC